MESKEQIVITSLRYPKRIRQKVEKKAKEQRRSLNWQLVYLIERGIEAVERERQPVSA